MNARGRIHIFCTAITHESDVGENRPQKIDLTIQDKPMPMIANVSAGVNGSYAE
jgi:hypothetical protein